MIDLRHILKTGMDNLVTWRNRYPHDTYPEKVVLNIFYRKYTMEFIFPELLNCFKTDLTGNPKIKWKNVDDGFDKIKDLYGETAVSKTQGVLIQLLQDQQRTVGNTSYSIFAPLIHEAKRGNHSKLEELEYAYLYYLLADEAIMYWAALGGTGLSKIDSIAKMSRVVLEQMEIQTYSTIEKILGQFCAAAYLKENYKPLPKND